MPLSLGSAVLGCFAGLLLLVLPGLALLRLCVPTQALDRPMRLSIAPGLSIGFVSLLFTWCDVVGLKFGPLAPWLLLALAAAVLLVRPTWKPPRLRGAAIAWLTLLALLITLLVVRFHATWGWLVPPGMDSPQHSLIVKLLLEHGGLFQSWAPYNKAETFSYHFGFHSVAALLAWMLGMEPASAVFVMARLMGVCAAAALFPMARMFSRTPWAGVFAVAVWGIYSRQLYYYDWPGRWTTLTGIATLVSPLVLLQLFLNSAPRQQVRLGVLCALAIAGLGITQYKVTILFVLLAGAFVAQLAIGQFRGNKAPLRALALLAGRAALVAIAALLLVIPRVFSVMETKTGELLKRTTLEAPSKNPAAYGAANSSFLELISPGFINPQKTVLSCLAICGAVLLVTRRRQGAWYVCGWLAALLAMNPGFIGLRRAGIIDEFLWQYLAETAAAVCAGVAVGFVVERFGQARERIVNAALATLILAVTAWSVLRTAPVPDAARMVQEDDLRLMAWIRENVPRDELIAGQTYLVYGQVNGFEALLWVPYFTQRRTNHTNLAAVMEKAPPDLRAKLKAFTRELYERDMSTPESAEWMRDAGFLWFYIGSLPPEHPIPIHPTIREPQIRLREQLMRNPRIHVAQSFGAASLLRVD